MTSILPAAPTAGQTAQGRMVSVVVPVYYSEASLPALFEQIVAVEEELLKRSVCLELIFVDDGSGDHSLAKLLSIKEQRPKTRIVKLTRNFGAVHASKTGMRFVTGDAFLVLAADLQDPPALVVQMVDRWLAGSKYVVCARQGRNDPLVSRLFAAIYYRLIRLFVAPDYPSGGYDMALMDRAMLPYILDSAKNINTPLFAYWLGFQPDLIRYVRQKRAQGASRWTLSKRVKFFIDSLLGFSIVPIRLMSLIGLTISLASFAYGSRVLWHALRYGVDVRGFATTVALITFMLGLVIVMLGVLGEYIWRIFDEVNRRPETVVETVY